MPPEEKESWEKKAQKDKARYEAEKSMYKGPWKIPANKRTPKDPSAPKRPMSAFLAFSNKRRAALKREHPDATNADLSKMLSRIWKEAPEETRSKYVEEEAGLRSHYKVEMGKWRKKVAEDKKVERQDREAAAMEAAETRPHESSVAPLPVSAIEGRQYARNSSSDSVGGPPMGGHPHQPSSQMQPDMNSGGMGPNGPGMYGNPYGMGGGQMGEYGGYGSMPPGPGPHGYPNMMGGFGPQSMMGGPSPQHQFISQLFSEFHLVPKNRSIDYILTKIFVRFNLQTKDLSLETRLDSVAVWVCTDKVARPLGCRADKPGTTIMEEWGMRHPIHRDR